MRIAHHPVVGAFLASIFLASALAAEPIPGRLQGSWRIVRVLPTTNNACWGREQAAPLIGSILMYRENTLRWHGGEVTLDDVSTRKLTAAEFSKENSGSETPASFRQLGIEAPSVMEVDLQHEDMDITGATTEVPGDSVLLAGPNRIIISACGVFFEATRTGGITHASLHH